MIAEVAEPVAMDARTKVAIVGLSNTGKSLIFNQLTGDYSVVSNYAGTTMEPKRAGCRIQGCHCEVIDTPGLHCLSIHSAEELSIRDLIFSERPDVIVQCVDANQLKQSLTLTADLVGLGVPMVLSLNAIDETARKGIWIDSEELSRILGIPVIETIATQGRGISDLKKAIAHPQVSTLKLQYPEPIENTILELTALMTKPDTYARKMASLFAMGDPFIEQQVIAIEGEQSVSKMRARIANLHLQYKGNVAAAIGAVRSRWVDEVAGTVIKHQKVHQGQFAEAFGHLCLHPVFGIPILFFFLALTYFLVVYVAGALQENLNLYLAQPVTGWIASLIPAGFFHELIVGADYGLLTLGLFNAVCTVLPILSVFFLMFGALEDMGYVPSLCVLTKRIFDRIGLNGNAAMSVVLGFGCKTMATLTTVGLPRKEQLIAVYLISAYVPCSAKMAMSMGVLGRYTFWALIFTYGIVFTMAVLSGLIMNRFLPDMTSGFFVQELPVIRWPNPRAVIVKTYYRLYWFFKEALPVFLGAALVMFFMHRTGLLGVIEVALQPLVVGGLGMPLDTVEAMILCLARPEAAAGFLIKMADSGNLSVAQSILAVLLTTMFVPCLASTVAMCKRLGWGMGVIMVGAMCLSAGVVLVLVHWILLLFVG